MNHLILLFFILSFSLVVSSFFVALIFYLQDKKIWKFKALLFIGFIVFLFLLTGVRYYLAEIAGLENSVLYKILRFVYLTAYSLLIYYLPATINYLLKRPWAKRRLIWVIVAASSHFLVGTILMIQGVSPLWSFPLGVFFFIAFIFILIDALRSLPLIQDLKGRQTLSLIFAETFIILPFLMIMRITGAYFTKSARDPALYFPVQTFFIFGLALLVLYYLISTLVREETHTPFVLEDQPLSFFEPWGITKRERDIILLLEKGITYKEIGVSLFISANTVSNHVANIYKKTGTRSRVEMLNTLRSKS